MAPPGRRPVFGHAGSRCSWYSQTYIALPLTVNSSSAMLARHPPVSARQSVAFISVVDPLLVILAPVGTNMQSTSASVVMSTFSLSFEPGATQLMHGHRGAASTCVANTQQAEQLRPSTHPTQHVTLSPIQHALANGDGIPLEPNKLGREGEDHRGGLRLPIEPGQRYIDDVTQKQCIKR